MVDKSAIEVGRKLLVTLRPEPRIDEYRNCIRNLIAELEESNADKRLALDLANAQQQSKFAITSANGQLKQERDRLKDELENCIQGLGDMSLEITKLEIERDNLRQKADKASGYTKA